jgi:hypothetical protein
VSRSAERFRGDRVVRISIALALIGVALVVAGVLLDPRRFFFSYLTAYAYAVSVAVGALLFLMITHSMRAGWPVAVRRLTETIVSALPLLAVLFLPLLFGMRRLYVWLDPGSIADEHLREAVLHKAAYLDRPFFLARTALYFAIWVVTGALLRRWSLRKDEDPALDVGERAQALSSAMLPPVGLATSFASIDWLMSLSPGWVSTMYPIYFFGGGFVSAIALLTVLTYAADRAGLLPGISESHYYALGRLLLAFTIFWAYSAYFQHMLIWIANRPDEVQFYVRRTSGPWRAVSAALVFAQFVLPFIALLSYRSKRRPAWLAVVAAWIVAAHYIDVHWLVVPELAPRGFPYSWIDAGALLAIGGASVAFAALRLRGKRTVPINDPELTRAQRYESA